MHVFSLFMNVPQIEVGLPLELAHLLVVADDASANTEVQKNFFVIKAHFAARVNSLLHIDGAVRATIGQGISIKVFANFEDCWHVHRSKNTKLLPFECFHLMKFQSN